MTLVDMVRLWLDTTTKTVSTMTRVSVDIVRNMASLPPPVTSEGIEAWRHKAAEYLGEILEIPDALVAGTPLSPAASRAVEVVQNVQPEEELVGPEAVRARFQELLDRSVQVDDQPGEPGFLDVVGAMSPDEARIVRYLSRNISAATLTLYAVPTVGRGSRLVLEHVCLVAQQAGCIDPERVAVYLENLSRLGVIKFTSEVVDDDGAYQLLQGMPEYKTESTRIRESNGQRPKGVQGSVRLTTFGRQFVEVCLGTRDGTTDAP